MKKIIDIDALFDKYIEKYIYENIGKVKPEEIENKMPILYKEFGDAKLAELNGKTPNTFYKDIEMQELLDCLKEHLSQNVSVSDFLCEAIIAREGEDGILLKELDKSDKSGVIEEEYAVYLMNFISDKNATIPTAKYLEFVLYDYPETIGELATEMLCKYADTVKDSVINAFSDADEDKKPRLCEILSNAKNDDRALSILIKEFLSHPKNVPLYTSFLTKYGDEKALPVLMETIVKDDISFADFEELRFAIESLGGEYNEKRDFTKDELYKKIKKQAPTKIM